MAGTPDAADFGASLYGDIEGSCHHTALNRLYSDDNLVAVNRLVDRIDLTTEGGVQEFREEIDGRVHTCKNGPIF